MATATKVKQKSIAPPSIRRKFSRTGHFKADSAVRRTAHCDGGDMARLSNDTVLGHGRGNEQLCTRDPSLFMKKTYVVCNKILYIE